MQINNLDDVKENISQEVEKLKKMNATMDNLNKRIAVIIKAAEEKNNLIKKLKAENKRLKEELKKQKGKTHEFNIKEKLAELKEKKLIKNDAELFLGITKLFIESYDDPKWRTEL